MDVRAVIAAAAGLLAAGTCPAVEVLDDSLSPRRQYNVQFRWAEAGDAFDHDFESLTRMIGEIEDVEVRLDTSAHVNRHARIYLRLPEHVIGLNNSSGLTLSWVTRGVLSPGHTTPGNRALVYEGVIDDPLLTDFFSYTFEVDARMTSDSLRIEPEFEIDVE